jgi:uncharacterized protein
MVANAAEKISETPFFLRNGSHDLFAIYHAPVVAHRRRPFLFCHPFGEEKLWTHRVLVSFARRLADLGHPVLRFDYMANGDSSGSFHESSVSTALSDIACALEELKRRTGCEQAGLLGLRLGATLASLTADERSDVDTLVLWAPIIDGDRYVQELLRINVTTQMAAYREVREDRAALVERFARGGTVNVDGYEMGPRMYEELSGLKLGATPPRFAHSCLLMHVDPSGAGSAPADLRRLQAHYGRGDLVVVHENAFWKETKRFYGSVPSMAEGTLKWLEDR